MLRIVVQRKAPSDWKDTEVVYDKELKILKILVQQREASEWKDTDISYTIDEISEIVKRRMHEDLIANAENRVGMFGRVKGKKMVWKMDQIETAFAKAFDFVIGELKGKTVSIV